MKVKKKEGNRGDSLPKLNKKITLPVHSSHHSERSMTTPPPGRACSKWESRHPRRQQNPHLPPTKVQAPVPPVWSRGILPPRDQQIRRFLVELVAIDESPTEICGFHPRKRRGLLPLLHHQTVVVTEGDSYGCSGPLTV